MSRHNKIGKHCTSVIDTPDGLFVQYHDTIVVKRIKSHITLNSGGWNTATTKLRMNQASKQFLLSFHVWQYKFDWFVCWAGKVYPFIDNMVLSTNNYTVTIKGTPIKPVGE